MKLLIAFVGLLLVCHVEPSYSAGVRGSVDTSVNELMLKIASMQKELTELESETNKDYVEERLALKGAAMEEEKEGLTEALDLVKKLQGSKGIAWAVAQQVRIMTMVAQLNALIIKAKLIGQAKGLGNIPLPSVFNLG